MQILTGHARQRSLGITWHVKPHRQFYLAVFSVVVVLVNILLLPVVTLYPPVGGWIKSLLEEMGFSYLWRTHLQNFYLLDVPVFSFVLSWIS